MIKNIYILFLFLIFFAPPGNVISSTSYHVGNSLTADMIPSGLASLAKLTEKNHQVGYHLKGHGDLDYIWSNPDDVTNISSFGNFTKALQSFEWNFITIQPYYKKGSTLSKDQAAISNLIDLALTGPSKSPIFYHCCPANKKKLSKQADVAGLDKCGTSPRHEADTSTIDTP